MASVDVGKVRAGSDGSSVVSMALDFSPGTPMDQVVGYVFLDVDEDPSTGVPATDVLGLPTQDVGVEYFLDLFETHGPDPVVLVDRRAHLRGGRGRAGDLHRPEHGLRRPARGARRR